MFSLLNIPRLVARQATSARGRFCTAAASATATTPPLGDATATTNKGGAAPYDAMFAKDSHVDDSPFVPDVESRFSAVDDAEMTHEPQQQMEYQRRQMGVNLIHLVGRVGNDPIVRGSDLHNFVVFSVATGRRARDQSGSGRYITLTDWHNVAITMEYSKAYAKNYIRKGDLVAVTGKLIYKKYNAVPTPERAVVVPQILVDRVQILLHAKNSGRGEQADALNPIADD